ncbi:hypothetical protein XELAEV_18010970mg [Xenopus laevis]|uniref:Uncharacterized protein n=1 Tax=Xenopus laevis TaxID=8355 RepID=A0A974DVJ6_XENLA|nr:hypothetical protein XELAEV_18010970mg [Xenopus laevis]
MPFSVKRWFCRKGNIAYSLSFSCAKNVTNERPPSRSGEGEGAEYSGLYIILTHNDNTATGRGHVIVLDAPPVTALPTHTLRFPFILCSSHLYSDLPTYTLLFPLTLCASHLYSAHPTHTLLFPLIL